MPPLIDDDFNELLSYLDHFTLQSVGASKEHRALLKSVHKRQHALLVWQSNLSSAIIWKGQPTKDQEYRLYFDETVSDLCISMFLMVQGMYKASYFCLRSSVENFVKCIGISQDQTVLSVTSVFELIQIVKETQFVAGSHLSLLHYSKLQQAYAHLCNHVHTANAKYMSLTTFVGHFPRFLPDEAKRFEALFRSVTTSMCCLLCFTHRDRYRRMRASHFDRIADILPKVVKADLMA